MLSSPLILLSLIALTLAKVHHLFVGNLGVPASIHALEFDDEALTLVKTKTIAADGSHPWISFDHNKKNLYGASFSKSATSSYSVLDGSSLRLDASIKTTGNCSSMTSAFVQSMSRAPFSVFSVAWPGPNACGQALSTYPNGTLKAVIQTWRYGASSGIHGLALGKGDNVLYSADLNGDSVWAHSFKKEASLVQEIGRWNVVRKGTHPRHLVAHPNGKLLHVLMESGNEVVEVEIDDTGVPVKELSHWSTIPGNATPANYWSAEILYSPSFKFLWATARAQSNTNLTGFINIYSLDPTTGRIVEKVAMAETTTKGGIANAIAPAEFSDEFAALADVPSRYVEIWRWEGGSDSGGKVLKAVAKVDINDGGCCANAIWYD